MPQTAAERLLSQQPPQQQPSGSTPAQRLLQIPDPTGPFGLNVNPMMGPFDETAVRESMQTEFDLPEITSARLPGLSPGEVAKVAGGLMLAADDAQRRDILENNIPGAQIGRDRFGHMMVIVPREGAFYLNKPGMSVQDATQLGAMAAAAIPAGRLGAAVGASIAGVPGRVAGAGMAEGALSAGVDLGLQTVGSEQPVSGSRAAVATAAGVGGEALLTMLTRRMSRLNAPTEAVTEEGGQRVLSPEARQIVEDAGLSPDQLTQDFIERLSVELDKTARPAEAVRVAEAGSLPVGVPLTRGNVTRRDSDMLFEDAASKGAFGRSVENIISGLRDEQQAALRANTEAIQARVAGGQRMVTERGQGGVIAQQALEELRGNAASTVSGAYDLAREAGQAGLPGRTIPGLTANLQTSALTRVDDIEAIPVAMRQINRLRELGQEVGDGAVLVDALFKWRSTVTNLAHDLASSAPSDARALTDMRRTFDAQMIDIVERGLLEGNEQAVDLWLGAVAARREFGGIWEAVNKDAPNYMVDRLTQTLPNGQQILAVAPENAANFIFGSSKAGLTTSPAIARQLQNLRGVLVEGGRRDAWDALREEAVVRLFNQAEGVFGSSTVQRTFSGAKLATAIDNMMTQNAPVMRVLFTRDELNLMDQLKRVAVSLEPTPGGANRSNTSAAAAQMFHSVFGKFFGKVFGPAIQVAARGDNMIGDLANLPFIIRAMRHGRPGAATPSMFSQPGVGAGIGATIAEE